MARIFVIGVGYKPLEKRAVEIISDSKAIFASDRLLEVFKQYNEYVLAIGKIRIFNSVSETMDAMRSQLAEDPSCVVSLIASGDPLFFGIGRRVIEEFGKDEVEILPDISSVQAAFARIREPWDNVFLVSMHGGPDKIARRKLEYELTDLPRLLQERERLALLTDDVNNPSVIAEVFLKAGVNSGVCVWVCERLGYPDEKVISGTPDRIAEMQFREPNVMIIIRKE